MGLREEVSAAVKRAMRDKASDRLSTLRLINAAFKDRDIAARSDGRENGVDEAELRGILGKMVKQRRESARSFEEAGRLDLAEQETAEIEVIGEFLPRRLTEEEVERAIDEAIAALGAASIRDMGRVLGRLKEQYSGQMDFAVVGPQVKDRLSRGA